MALEWVGFYMISAFLLYHSITFGEFWDWGLSFEAKN